ncbi:MAG: prolyl oligopeptidase family serine peptidase [Ignavibacteria bacterium]|nr:prolyl oligopeptidase family serine peptidase [Ignavibacteria bacterium]
MEIKRLIITLFIVTINFGFSQEPKQFNFVDAMKFPTIRHQNISNDGRWVGYSFVFERGDPISFIVSTETESKISFPRALKPEFSNNSKWVAFQFKPKQVDVENSEKEKPSDGVLLFDIFQQKKYSFEKAEKYLFSVDSRWFALQLKADKAKKDESKDEETKKEAGSPLLLLDLNSMNQIEFQYVTEFSFDTLSNYLAFAVVEPTGKKNGLYLLKLKGEFALPIKADCDSGIIISSLAWNNTRQTLSYVKCWERGWTKVDSCAVFDLELESLSSRKLVDYSQLSYDWFIPSKNTLKWSEDGLRLFFGIKPKIDTSVKKEKIKFNDTTLYDIPTVLKKADYTLWHWNDPRIKTHEKTWWGNNKDRTFLCVYHIDSKRFIQLANFNIPNVEFVDNPKYTIGFDSSPYSKESTWEGHYSDLYVINLITGEKKLIGKRLNEGAHLSPQGKYVVYYKDKNWYLYDTNLDTLLNMTGQLRYAFYDEDYDQPSPPPSYGFGGWFENDAAFLIYDKYDIWKFYTEHYSYMCQTVIYGRDNNQTYRIIDLKENKKFYANEDSVLLSVFNHNYKTTSIYALQFRILGPDKLLEEPKNFKVFKKAKDTDLVLFSRESYDEFPDLWVADMSFQKVKRITNHNEELLKKYLWGSTELVRWVNSRNDTLDGFIVKPPNFDPKKKYPLIVYFYEKFSQLMHNFQFPYIGHRPCFQLYTTDNYILFLPDIKYVIGSPGNSALDCIVSGVRKLISFGFIDTTAIGIMGHSWSGYQAAYIITQTNLFKAAVAGAAVGNMTSAYSGIRLESGLARLFQYERYQSRIGGNLWDSLQAYINNSPIFKAQTASTPLLLMFGDEDQAVPWQQGIELYLAFRRLGKPVFFLQYHNEKHWPNKFQNKLDYAIKIKEFFDTFLKKKPAPEWITKGEDYLLKE